MTKCSRNRARTGPASLGLAMFGVSLMISGLSHASEFGSLSLKDARSTLGTTQRIVIDPTTGLALKGFDPVSYFIDREPRPGLPRYEIAHAGAYWRFANEGNLAAFKAHPEAYMPQFGGYGALSVARGSTAPGNPAVWVVYDKRLYLFYSPTSRTVWLMKPNDFARDGAAAWPALENTLAR